jgi:membrane protease YdiL (CAAX protease family)
MAMASTPATVSHERDWRPAGLNHVEQHPLWLSIALHLFPGVAMGAFILIAVPVFEGWGIDPLFALFGGIALVAVPLELGYLAIYSYRTTGRWAPLDAVALRKKLSARMLTRLGIPLAAWFFLVLVAWMAGLDTWLAGHVFGWLPHDLRQFASLEGTAPNGLALVLLFVVAFVFNGFAGPVVEEMYFRGHLMPRLERFGRAAPVISTALFALYHVWTPWRWPAILVGFTPIAWQARERGSIYVSMTAHLVINNVYLLLMVVGVLAQS